MTDAVNTWLCPDLLFDGQSLLPGQAVGLSHTTAIAISPPLALSLAHLRFLTPRAVPT